MILSPEYLINQFSEAMLWIYSSCSMILKYWKLNRLFQRTFHGNWFAREKVAPAGSGCGAVTVVYKPVAFQDSAAVTFDHTWLSLRWLYHRVLQHFKLAHVHWLRRHQESRVNVGINNIHVYKCIKMQCNAEGRVTLFLSCLADKSDDENMWDASMLDGGR